MWYTTDKGGKGTSSPQRKRTREKEKEKTTKKKKTEKKFCSEVCVVGTAREICSMILLAAVFFEKFSDHGCSNYLNLEMEAECLTKNLSCLNLNISRTINGRNKL